MATKVVNQVSKLSVGGFSLADALGIAVLKSVSEQALAPLVGNGDVRSGLWKLGGAVVLPSAVKMLPLSGKLGSTAKALGKLEATALAIDGTEDIARSAVAFLFGNSAGNAGGVM